MLRLDVDTSPYSCPDIAVPDVWTIRQKIDAPVLKDVEGPARDVTRVLFSDPRLKADAKVAVGVGSRGIANLVTIVRAVVDELKRNGTDPFIVPAMGSHGGATAEGQTGVLAEYGVVPDNVGAPIRATMDVAQVAAL